MIYDEGFEVNVDGLSFFAFSRFDLFHDHGVKKNISHCDQTMVGWYHDTHRKNWGCYFGKKVKDEGETHMSLMSFVPPHLTKSPAFDAPLSQSWHEDIADSLNRQQQGWVARAYEKFAGKSARELNRMAGIRRSLPISSQLHHHHLNIAGGDMSS